MKLKCRCCGGLLIKKAGGEFVCENCGTRYENLTPDSALSAADMIRRQRIISELLSQAGRNQEKGDYDEAFYLYETALEAEPENAEAYWGKVLSRYGVLYVSEKKNGITVRKPTLNRMSSSSILKDPDYLHAVQYAEKSIAEKYRQDASAIAAIQKRYLELTAREKPFDVFISFKAQDTITGEATEDSAIAYQIYERLNSLGNLNVFFSKVTLQENAAGRDYEPVIYAALNSAKVMILVGTTAPNVDSQWVKNEWSRFLVQMQADSSKTIIPVIKGMSAEELPERIPHGNALPYEGETTLAALTEGVLVLTGKGSVIDADDTEHLISELREQMKETCASGNFDKVSAIADEVLDIDARYAEAWYYLLLAQYRAKSASALARVEEDWSDSRYYKRAVLFGDKNLVSRLNAAKQQQQLLKEDKEKEKAVLAEKARQEAELEVAFNWAKSMMGKYNYSEAQKILTNSASRHPKAKEALNECNLALEAARVIGNPDNYYETQLKKKNPALFAAVKANMAQMRGLKGAAASAKAYLIQSTLTFIGMILVFWLSESHELLGILIGAVLGLYGTFSCGEKILSIVEIADVLFSLLLVWGGDVTYYDGTSFAVGAMVFGTFLSAVLVIAVVRYLRALRYEKILAKHEAVQKQLAAFNNEESAYLMQNYFSKLPRAYVKKIRPRPMDIGG